MISLNFQRKLKREQKKKILETDIAVYTSEDLYSDYRQGKIIFSEQEKSVMKTDEKKEKRTEVEDIRIKLEELFEDLYGDEEDYVYANSKSNYKRGN
jgi:hypothetical protein